MAALARQLAASCVEAYCRGSLAALGFAGQTGAGGKAELPQDWLGQLLLAPLLQAACR